MARIDMIAQESLSASHHKPIPSSRHFAIFSLWLPEQYTTQMRATAFAFCTSFGRFLGAAANFAIAGLIAWTGSLGHVIALTAIPFVLGLAVIPFALETRGQKLP